MPLLLFLVGASVVMLAKTAPFPFVLEAVHGERTVWRGPRHPGQLTIYLTYDDGPNPTATPALLDVLRREQATATFFVIPLHLTPETAPIVRRTHEDGHGVALHSHTRALITERPDRLAARLRDHAAALAAAGAPPCRLFRPHAGWRSASMYAALDALDYQLAGWSFGQWDWNWWRSPKPAALAERLARRAEDGDIVVLHDGHHQNPRSDRQRTVDATAALIPRLRARGFSFRSLCDAVR